jgi:hypothetical protein
VLVREYKESDLEALRAIHAAQGFDYALPDLCNPLFVTRLVLTQDLVPALVGAQHAAPLHCDLPNMDVSAARAAETSSTNVRHSEPACAGRLSAAQQRVLASENLNARGEGNCRILGAALLRLTAEAYLLLDPRAGTPRERWQWLLALHEAARRDAWQRGLEDVHAWLPPPIAQKFGRRLERLGWRRDDSWTPYCIRLRM